MTPMIAHGPELCDLLSVSLTSTAEGDERATSVGRTEQSSSSEPQIPLGDEWMAGLSPIAGGAMLRVAGGAPETALEITISLTAAGPVLRARAAAVELVADHDIVARCESFRVEARKDVVLTAGSTLQGQGRRVERGRSDE